MYFFPAEIEKKKKNNKEQRDSSWTVLANTRGTAKLESRTRPPVVRKRF